MFIIDTIIPKKIKLISNKNVAINQQGKDIKDGVNVKSHYRKPLSEW